MSQGIWFPQGTFFLMKEQEGDSPRRFRKPTAWGEGQMPFHRWLEQIICLYLRHWSRMNLLNVYQMFVLILHEIIYWKWCPFRSWAARWSLVGNFNYSKLVNIKHSFCAFCVVNIVFSACMQTMSVVWHCIEMRKAGGLVWEYLAAQDYSFFIPCPGQCFSKVLPFIVVWLDSRLTRQVKGAETYNVCLKTRAVCSVV